ncbi:hypothetical protein [Lysinibacillus sp. FSL M8-0134]|uniref:hypothetical protein n=1 Tax=Lysinibacillus sp. FSL M8-0134 TaxID=2921717 RepID=UPI00311A6A32
MVNLLKEVTDNGYLLIFISIVIYIVPRAINYWKVSELEKKFMNDFEKIKVDFLKLSLVIIVIYLIIILYMIANPKEYKNIFEEHLNILIFAFAFIWVYVVVASQLVMTFVMWLDKILSRPINYFIQLEGTTDRWKIIKMGPKDSLIIYKENNDNLQMVLENWRGREIIIERSDQLPCAWLFDEKEIKNRKIPINLIIISTLFLGFSILMFILIYNSDSLISTFYFFGALLGIIITTLLIRNYRDHKDFNNNANSNATENAS